MDVIAPRYVTRFECAGAACEDTCCSGWNVTVDRDAYRRLRSVLGEELGAGITRIRDRPRTKEKFGLVVLEPDTLACTFLNEKRLCSLHARFGEEVLPDGCASFPRRQSSVGTRIETSLSLACPEAAREALIPRDAMELVDLDPADLSRQHRVQEFAGANDYERSLDPVRQSLLEILAGPGTLASRLESVVRLVHEQGATAIDDVASSLLSLLRILSRRSTYPDGRFDRLMQHALTAYGISDEARIGDVAAAFVARRDATLVGPRLDELLTSYAMNHVFSRWFTSSPSLGVWVRGLVLRVAMARFLVLAHPSLADATVERVAVEVISRMSREVDHHPLFSEWLDEHLAEELPAIERVLGLAHL